MKKLISNDKSKFIFDIIPSWIIILLPVFLITGPFLSDLGISLVAVLFLINSKKNNLIKYYDNYYFKFFLIFCLIFIVSSLLSDNSIITKKFFLLFSVWNIFTMFLVSIRKRIKLN